MSADAVRTPEELLEGLPDYPFVSRYREVEGLRLAHLDEGEGRPVVFFHGEPTWSFLWRKVIPPVRDAGFRCIAPDYAGFGRSDKPTDLGWYTYDRHVELMAMLLEELDLRDATVVVHDWGGPIGLRLAVEHPDRVSRIVIMETGPFTGHQRMSDAWFAFRDFVRDNEDVPIGTLIRGGCKEDPGDDVIAAYDAPYTDPSSKAGARAFPLILPTTPEALGAAEGKRVADGSARRRAALAGPMGRFGPDPALPRRRARLPRARADPAAADRGCLSLPPGGRRPRDRRDHRRVARLISSAISACERCSSSWTRRGGPLSSTQVTVPGQ
ncbi:MAG: alpha/beta fold hydrolase [Solirubrobacterales bacterium]